MIARRRAPSHAPYNPAVVEDPHAGCGEFRFCAPLRLTPAAEVALEDYARVLCRARLAEARHAVEQAPDAAPVVGLHLCDPEEPCAGALAEDIEAFARELATSGAPGLGWS